MNFREFIIRILPALLFVIAIQSLAISLFDVPIYGDSEEYLLLGKNLHDKNLLSFDGVNPSRMRQPIYPAFLSLAYYSLGESFLVVKLFQALAGLFSFLLILRLYILVRGTQHLRLAAVIIGLYVPLWWNCALILSEPLAILVVTSYLLSLYSLSIRWSIWRCLATGVILGLAVLTRPISIALLPLMWVPIVVDKKLSGRRALTLASVVLGCLIALAPWAARNYFAFGELSPLSVEGQYHALQGTNLAAEMPQDSVVDWETLRDSLASQPFVGTIIEQARQHPLSYFWKGIKRVVGSWIYFPGSRNFFDSLSARLASYGFQIVFLILAVLGLSKLDAARRWFLVYPAISFSIILFFSGEGISRLLLPILPPILIAFVVGLNSVWTTAKSRILVSRG